jgi:ribosome-associated protein
MLSTFGAGLAGPEVNHGDSDGEGRATRGSTGSVPRADRKTEGGLLKIATRAAAPFLTLSSLERACLSARVAVDHKARDVVVLDMRPITPLYDYLVLATGNSRRQIHTISEEVDAALHEIGDDRLSIEGYEASKWVVQDYGDVIVHVFDAAAREYYGLEDLWADAPRVDWEQDEG